MKYKSEDRIKILEYKFIFEEDLQVKKEYEEGAADLNYRLSFFREKLHKTNNTSEQKERYDKIFMGQVPKQGSNEVRINEIDAQESTQSAHKNDVNEKPWVKRMYRQIVMTTHPDKINEIVSVNLKNKLTEQYRITQNAYNKKIYSDLIMVAFDLNINIPEGVVEEQIIHQSEIKKKRIGETKKKLGWQWYHVPDNLKDSELKKILSLSGFKFTDDQVKKVIRTKYVKRKPGTRPAKSIRNQRNISKK
jgi:hypothetical protein